MKLFCNRATRVALAYFVVAFCLGCESSSNQVATGESSLELGLTAFREKEFSDAERLLSDSLEKGSLNADLMSEAKLARAIARIELDDFDGAREDLEFLLEGAPNVVEVLVTLGRLAIKEGNNDEAKRFFHDAKKQDPKLVIPPELR
jgi:uncharacterized protein HemY